MDGFTRSIRFQYVCACSTQRTAICFSISGRFCAWFGSKLILAVALLKHCRLERRAERL